MTSLRVGEQICLMQHAERAGQSVLAACAWPSAESANSGVSNTSPPSGSTTFDSSEKSTAPVSGSMLTAWAGTSWTATSMRSEEHTSELQSLMRISYAFLCFKTQI